jgi:hypothetical protein
MPSPQNPSLTGVDDGLNAYWIKSVWGRLSHARSASHHPRNQQINLLKYEFTLPEITQDPISRPDAAAQDFIRKPVLHLDLNGTSKRTRAINTVKSLFGHPFDRLVRIFKADLQLLQAIGRSLEHFFRNAHHILPGQPVKYNDLVDAVQKLGLKNLPDLAHHLVAHGFIRPSELCSAVENPKFFRLLIYCAPIFEVMITTAFLKLTWRP